MKRTFTVKSDEGLHARPAAIMAKAANQYDPTITMYYEERSVNMKSVMGVMALGIPPRSDFTIEVEDDDAETILDDFESILKEHSVI